MARHKNAWWSLGENPTWEGVQVALLMDLRDELQALNAKFSELPCAVRTLTRIERQLKLQRRCPVHPRYTGARPPSVDCRACRRYYRAVWK